MRDSSTFYRLFTIKKNLLLTNKLTPTYTSGHERHHIYNPLHVSVTSYAVRCSYRQDNITIQPLYFSVIDQKRSIAANN